MGLLDRLERALESLVEGRLPRSFAGRVHPLEIARALGREMVSQCRVGVRKRYAPNLFRVKLHDADADALMPIENSVLEEVREYLLEEAGERDLVLCGPLCITLVRDPEARPGVSLVECSFLEEPTPSVTALPPVVLSQEGPPTHASASPLGPVRTLLRGTSGFAQGVILVLRGDAMTLGRLPDSDLPVPDAKVSRQHALIRRTEETWSIEDRGSRHGTRVNGVPISARQSLMVGDEIQVGDSSLRVDVEAVSPPDPPPVPQTGPGSRASESVL